MLSLRLRLLNGVTSSLLYINFRTLSDLGIAPTISYSRSGDSGLTTLYALSSSNTLQAFPATASNIAPGSNDFANATYWTNSGVTIGAASGVTAPDGTTNTYQLTVPSAAGSYFAGNSLTQAFPGVVASTTYVMSVWIYVASGTQVVGLAFTDGVTTQGKDITATTGLNRYNFSFTSGSSISAGSAKYGFANPSTNAGYTAYIFGYQFELGSIVTNYKATTTAASASLPVPRLTAYGLLGEPTATQLQTNTNDFGNSSYWNYSGSVTRISGQTDPTGGTGATQLSFAAATQGNNALQGPFLTLSSGQVYTASVWLEGVGASQVAALAYFNGTSSVYSPDFVLTTGWNRYLWTFTGSANSSFSLLFLVGGSGGAASVYNAFEMQLETGTTATSNIHSVTGNPVRGAETISVTIGGSLHNLAVAYLGGLVNVSNPTSPIALGSASGGAWVGNYIQSITIT